MKASPHRRHLVYLWLLHKGLTLSPSHARQVSEVWYDSPGVEMVYANGYATDAYSRIWFAGVRSVPELAANLIVCSELAKLFDLSGVAGFYREGETWRLNADPTRSALLKPYRDERGLIAGLLVHSHARDRKPRLLTSRFLPSGTQAEPYYPYLERKAA